MAVKKTRIAQFGIRFCCQRLKGEQDVVVIAYSKEGEG